MNYFDRACELISITVAVGDVYRLSYGSDNIQILVELTGADLRCQFEFKMLKPQDGNAEAMELYKRIDRTIIIEPRLFERMRGDGRAVMPLRGLRSKKSPIEIGEVTPLNLLNPDEPKISRKERLHRLSKSAEYERRRSVRYYTIQADQENYLGRAEINTKRFIRNHKSEAMRLGYTYVPSYGTLLRAIDQCGEPHSRPLSAFFYDHAEYERYVAWHPFVKEHFEEAVASYWHKDAPSLSSVRIAFYHAINTRRGEIEAAGGAIPDNLGKPSPTTFRTWLYGREDWWLCKERHGELVANARFRGHGRHIKATRPLEYVIIDHTVADCWAIIEDDDGHTLIVERPTLTFAIDVYSRMILAAVLSYEAPSLYQAMAALKQIISFKGFLVDEFGPSPATDGWGKPATIIVDNGWEFCGLSFQLACEAAGIDVIWAPVRTPEFKAIGESIFRTFNLNFWHELKGGIRLTPQLRAKLRIDAQITSAHTIEQLEQLIWARILIYHNTTHTQTFYKPALLWKKGLKHRPVIDDLQSFGGFLGKGERVKLHPDGIYLDGERYHDQSITSALLQRLLPRAPRNSKKGNPLRRSTVELYASRDPLNANYIDVWDHVSKMHVRLPHLTIKKRISWKALKALRAFVQRENDEFFSQDQLIEAHAQFQALIKSAVGSLPFGKARRLAPELNPAPELKPGNRVQMVAASASPAGMNATAQMVPAKSRDDNLVPSYGTQRGKRKPRSAKRQAADNPRMFKPKTSTASPGAAPLSIASSAYLVDPDAFMDSL